MLAIDISPRILRCTERAAREAGLTNVAMSAGECVRFERQSFGALRQVLADLTEEEWIVAAAQE